MRQPNQKRPTSFNIGAIIVAGSAALAWASPSSAKISVRNVGMPYQTITLDLEGPTLDQAKGPNPFADYRLDISFDDGTEQIRVPGYFAACGRSAETGCTRGRIWRARFVPTRAGDWSYRIAFRKGIDLVASGGLGESVSRIDGSAGTFKVTKGIAGSAETRGILRYTGDSYYRWSGTGKPAFKLGLDSPENMLAYADFDATPDAKGFRKTWAPHLRDFDPAATAFTWRGGKGKGLLGRLRYVQQTGLSGVSMLLFNVGGDDQNVVPQILRVSASSYAALSPKAQWDAGVMHDRYQVSKLEQWQRVFDYANSLGLRLHFKLGENENDHFMDEGRLGRERRIYLREMVARFGSIRAVVWNVGEENVQDAVALQEETAYIDALDPYDHPVVMHTFPQQKERYRALLGRGSSLTGLSLQGRTKDFADMRPEIVKWKTAGLLAGRPWVIGYDELGTAGAGAPIDAGFPLDRLAIKGVESLGALDVPAAVKAAQTAVGPAPDIAPSRETYRRHAVWNALTAGGEGIEVYYGWTNRCHDLGCENDRTRSLKFADGVKALRFFEDYVGERALTMSANDELTSDPTDYVLADHGRTYVIFTTLKTPVFLAMFGQSGRYRVEWYDALKGGALQTGSNAFVDGGERQEGFAGNPTFGYAPLGDPPAGGSGEWAILLRRVDHP